MNYIRNRLRNKRDTVEPLRHSQMQQSINAERENSTRLLVNLSEIEAERENLTRLLGDEMKKFNRCHMDKKAFAKRCSNTESMLVRTSLANFKKFLNLAIHKNDFLERYRVALAELDRFIINYYRLKYPWENNHHIPHPFLPPPEHNPAYYHISILDRLEILRYYAEKYDDDLSPVEEEFEKFYNSEKDEYFKKQKLEDHRIGAAILQRELQAPVRQFVQQSKRKRSKRSRSGRKKRTRIKRTK